MTNGQTLALLCAMAVSVFALAGLAILFWAIRRRTQLVFSQIIYFTAEFVVFILLVSESSPRPVFTPIEADSWLYLARVVRLISMWYFGWQYYRRIRDG